MTELLQSIVPESVQTAVIWILAFVIGGTHVTKAAWTLAAPDNPPGVNRITLTSFGLAALAAWQLWPPSDLPWWLAAMILGPAANQLYRVGLAPVRAYLRKKYGFPPVN